MKNITLFTKSIRDMKKSLSQFVSIFLMAMIAMIIVTGLDTLWVILIKHSNTIYENTNASDIWITLANPTEQEMWKIYNTDGVKIAEKRLKINAKTELDGDPILTVYAAPISNTLDQPFMVKGEQTKTGAVLDQKFAEAHGIELGDSLKIKVNDQWIKYKVEGFCFSSEHLFSVNSTVSTMPEPNRYGFIMVNIDTITEAFYGAEYYNQIEIRLDNGADIKSVEESLDNKLKDRLITLQKQNDTLSFVMVDIRVEQFKVLALVFSSMFFVVTALITLSTMIRLVEDQRNQIGIMKALGYSKKTILWHYTSYGIYVGALGSTLGCILGPNVITRPLLKGVKEIFTLHTYKMHFNWVNIVLLSLFIVLCTGGAAAFSCYQLLDEMPSELLRIKVPKKGSHIFLEKVNFLWNKMNFSHKLIARNLVRNKARFFMSSFGIMGCTALILAALTLHSTIKGTSVTTYEKVYVYDDKLILDEKSSDRFFDNLQINAEKQSIKQGGIYVKTDTGYRKTVSVTITGSDGELINLPDKNGKGRIILPENGVILTRKQAQMMELKEGDTIYLKRTDDTFIPVVITISLLTQGQGIFMSDTFYESLGETYVPTALLVKWDGEPNKTAEFFINSDRVTNHITRLQQKKDFETSLKIMNVAVILLIIFGASLAFIVIYNMGMLNFFERVRDLSTLMVLGFYKKEIQFLVLVDNILSASLGLALGLPLGVVLAKIILMYMGSDFDLIPQVTKVNVALSAFLTILFAILVNRKLSKKMTKIDMLGALKSVE